MLILININFRSVLIFAIFVYNAVWPILIYHKIQHMVTHEILNILDHINLPTLKISLKFIHAKIDTFKYYLSGVE